MADLLVAPTTRTTTPAPVAPPGAEQVAHAVETAALAAAVTAWGPVPRVSPRRRTRGTLSLVLAVCVVAATAAFAFARVVGANPEPAAAAEPAPSAALATDAATRVPQAAPVAPAVMEGPGVLPAGFSRWSATLSGDELTARVVADPDAAVAATLGSVNEFGDTQVVGVVAEAWGGDGRPWVRVQLPVRPNGASGWVPASEVQILGHSSRIEIRRSTATMVLFEADAPVREWSIAVGPDRFPTPLGSTYVWTKFREGPASAYGPGVLGLSLFSEVLNRSNWPGDARIGIHGAATQAQLGGRAGHGCVRMLNSDVAPLLADLPLGTPVDIVA